MKASVGISISHLSRNRNFSKGGIRQSRFWRSTTIADQGVYTGKSSESRPFVNSWEKNEEFKKIKVTARKIACSSCFLQTHKSLALAN